MTTVARPVIIVGAEPRKVVTIARSLHRAGVRCLVATTRGEALRVSSRAIAGTLRLHGDVAEQAEVLARLGRSEGAGWVVPTSDETLQVVSAAYRELSRSCAVGAPAPAIVQRVLDKSVLLATARNAGVPAPVPVSIARAADLESVLPTLRFPLVARLRDASAKNAHEFRMRVFATADELRATFATQTRFGEGLLFHPHYPGQGVGVEVLLSKGALITSFQHRRESEHPSSGGVTVVAISEPVDARLLEHSVRLLRALEWDGVASVKFRCDAASGEATVMDVSGHFWGSLPLDIAAGVDFPLLAWQLSQGLTPTPPASYRSGVRVRWTAGSLTRASAVFAHPRTDRIPLGRALRQLGADFGTGTKSALWSWRDPFPAQQEVAHALVQSAKDATKSILRAIVPDSLLSVAKDSRNLVAARRPAYVGRRLQRMLGLERAVSLPRPANSVLFVCHGNIMRSAAAAGFLRDELRAAGVANVKIGSAGTHAHDGRPADARAQEAARQLGLSLREHTATRLTTKLVADYDVIFAMDDLNYVNIATTFPESRPKLRLFGGMNASGRYRAHEIPDPYMTSPGEVNATIGRVKHYVSMLARALIAERSDVATSRAAAAASHERNEGSVSR